MANLHINKFARKHCYGKFAHKTSLLWQICTLLTLSPDSENRHPWNGISGSNAIILSSAVRLTRTAEWDYKNRTIYYRERI